MINYKPILGYLLFALLLAVPPVVLTYTATNSVLMVPHFWLIFFFVSGLTFIAVFMVLLIQQVNAEMYAAAFLGATTFKILACLVFVLVFTRKNHPERLIFIADFMYVYFLNTAFEIYALLRSLRNQNLK